MERPAELADQAPTAELAERAPELGLPRRRVAPLVSGAIAVALAALILVLGTRPPAAERQAESPLIGRLAPPVSGVTLEGEAVDVDSYRGRWLVVNFFATWCVTCIAEHPELVAFAQRHRASGDAALLSVVVETPEDEARRFFERQGGGWPVVLDPEGTTALDFGMIRVPETFLVAPDGTVVNRIIGGVTAAGLSELIAAYENRAVAG